MNINRTPYSLYPLTLILVGTLCIPQFLHTATRSSSRSTYAAPRAAPTPTAAAETIPLHLQDGSVINFDIHEIDVFTQEPFKDLIREYQRAGEEYIVARVLLQNKEKPVAYYDAHSLNRYILKTFREQEIAGAIAGQEIQTIHMIDQEVSADYPLRITSQDKYSIPWQASHRIIITDPPTRTPILSNNDIEYFIYDPQEPTQGFIFLCTYKEFIRPDMASIRDIFYVNQHNNLSLKQETSANIGLSYYRSRDYANALHYFTRAATMTNNEAGQVLSNYYLGRMYYLGQGVTTDYQRALYYFTRPIIQRATPAIKAYINFYLGRMNRLGQGMAAPDFNRAFTYLTAGVRQTADLDMQAACKVELGLIYYLGQGTAPDFHQAYTYFNEVDRPAIPMYIRCYAQYYLGRMHYLGQGMQVNFSQAISYFTFAANQTERPTIRAAAQLYLSDCYFFGLGGFARDVRRALSLVDEALKVQGNKTISDAAQQIKRSFNAMLDQEKVVENSLKKLSV